MTKTEEVEKLRHLKKLGDMVYGCIACGDCRTAVRYTVGRYKVCPVLEHTAGFEPFFARGKMQIIRGLLEGKLQPSQELANVIYQCTTCGDCHATCHQSMDPDISLSIGRYLDHTKIYEALRADLVDAGYGPMPRHREILEWCEKEHNPYMELHENRVAWIPEGVELPSRGELAFFMGCTEPYRQPELIQRIVKLLLSAGVTPAVIHPEEYCCGSVALRTGMYDLAEELALHNIKAFQDAGAKEVVVHCAGCYRTLKKDYPEIYGKELPFKVVHITEILDRLLKEERLKLREDFKGKKLTYHDPCHIGRHCDFYEPPREIIKKLLGVEFVEMNRNRTASWCCGAGGGLKSGFPDLAEKIARVRVGDAKEVGADYIVTVCPFCENNLRSLSEKEGIPVLDIVDLFEI
ncbi:MAG: (Fe-S)-binding protein [Candidatus Jordarchaeum sp.]|uniref:(Fe-S)-binding protein n=1 Tax=Candidatus Jordarchaeum sp. TaxID=2823881 RepID=UPI00404AB188